MYLKVFPLRINTCWNISPDTYLPNYNNPMKLSEGHIVIEHVHRTMSKLKAILKWKTLEGLNNSAISEEIELELLGIS